MTALSEAAGGSVLPSLPVTLAYVRACGGDATEWERRWHKLTQELAPCDDAEPAQPAGEAPYLGLATFGPEHADLFFGRERLVRDLCARLAETPLLAVFGASGAGKSSLLRAGLIPAISTGIAPGAEDWRVALFTPGEHPLEALCVHLANLNGIAASSLYDSLNAIPAAIRVTVAQLLAERPAGACVLVVVDQFEEIFTVCEDERERALFISVITALAGEPRARVLLGVRADFYAHCARYGELIDALQDRQVLVGPMDEEDLRQAIIGPAERVGCKVDPRLVDLVVSEVRDQSGALPLISHTLLETWRRRRGAALTLAGYRAAGGVHGAIAMTAERVHDELPDDLRHLVRRVMLRLTAPGDGTEDTRRRAPRLELVSGPDSVSVAFVLDRLIERRLVTADQDSVTVAHEALIRTWPRLRSWLAEDRDLLRAHRKLTEAAGEWDQHGRDGAFLYRGARLARWEEHPLDQLNDLERDFLATGRRQQASERAAARRRVCLWLAGLTSAVLAVSVLAAMTLAQAGQLTTQRDIAISRQLAAEARAQSQFDPELALRQARRAYAVWPTDEAETVLRQGLIDDRLIGSVPGHQGRALGVVWSEDGLRLASSSSDGVVRVWDRPGTGLPKGPPVELSGHRGEVWSPVFSPDGRRLATAGIDGTVRVWSLDGGTAPRVFTGHRGPVWNVAFSPDGRRVASAGDDGTVRIWDAAGTGRPRVLHGHKGAVAGVAFAPDGLLASSGYDGTVRIWDATGRKASAVLRGHRGAVKNLRFNPRGTRIAGAGVDGTARIWPVKPGADPVVLRGHDGTVEGLSFSPDGRWLATTSDDSSVRIWSSSGGGHPLVLRGHQRVVWNAAFSPDGARLATAGEDGTVRIWSPWDGTQVLRGHRGAVWTTAFSPDGRRLYSGGIDGTVSVWDLATGGRRVLRGHREEVLGVTAGRDGRHVVSASRDGTVRIWDTTGAKPPVILRGHRGVVWTAALSPDGRRVASAGVDGTLRIWPADGNGPAVVRQADDRQIRYAAFSPDGRRVVTGGQDGTVRIWDAGGAPAPVVLRGHQGLVWSVAFSPDGRRVASAGADGTVRVWPVDGRAAPLVHRGHQGMVWSVAFSGDGRWVTSAGHDDTVRIWRSDVAGDPLTIAGFGASVESVEFAPDGRRLATAHGDGTIRVWNCDACAPTTLLLQGVDRRVDR
ncbi:hypothetical protein GCM10022226_17170 [Sphaerisporangium flaviroseum]|uniref:Novel STAND NTPase 1 domain-containing protein n=1 Tax=Sphaerisporangium flaviroseum TaxID=509199 RepID=A0ABP7HMZ2_9ACTN